MAKSQTMREQGVLRRAQWGQQIKAAKKTGTDRSRTSNDFPEKPPMSNKQRIKENRRLSIEVLPTNDRSLPLI
jgi:hypothetical protein